MERRNFIAKTLKGTLGLSLGYSTLANARSANAIMGANNKIVLSLIGCGGRGVSVLDSIIAVNKDIEVKYLCDVNETLAAIPKEIDKYNKLQGYAPKFINNMKKVLEDKDVDGVVIATP